MSADRTNFYCISSRIRIARNIVGYPFCDKMSDEQFSEMIDKVRGALGSEFRYINFSSLPTNKKKAYVEQHIVSPEFSVSKHKTALFLNKDGSIAIMVGEEDHIRIQAFSKDLALDTAYAQAAGVERLLEKSLEFLFDDKYGYITKCPTNLGTGLRASVMMFLPATVNASTVSVIASELTKRGMVIRGVYGEGSSSLGSLYQISNNVTLGASEEDIISKVKENAERFALTEDSYEIKNFNSAPDVYKDLFMRSLGILRSAHIMSTAEATELLIKVKQGINCNALTLDKDKDIDELFTKVMPHTISEISGREFSDEQERDIYRAEFLRGFFE